MPHRERFAPSPTGPLHLGHAFSALTAFETAQSAKGQFLLRIEDIDQTRARAQWEDQIYRDLEWLGITWEQPVLRQSERRDHYRAALQQLWSRGLLYTCTCNRRDIQAALSAPQEGAELPSGPDGLIYPGTCAQDVGNFGTPNTPLPEGTNLRLSMARALPELPEIIGFWETCALNAKPEMLAGRTLTQIGDIILARRDFGTSYHLSVVLDDAFQNITHVTRGEDLVEATFIHVILQKLLDLPTPIYHHHRLIRDEAGKRLAKRDDARAISKYREDGLSPEDLKALVERV